MRLRVETCAEADAEHQWRKRQYAHVFHRPGVICVAHAFRSLPQVNQLGLLLHEVGHVLAGPSGGERAANIAAKRHSGITVHYRHGAHGRNLEWIRPKDKERAREFLGL